MLVLITGAGGQLARALMDESPEHLDVIGLSRLEMDITDEDRVSKTIGFLKPDVVIHTAAFVNVDQAENDPDLARRINVLGTQNVVKACMENDCILVHISTDFVFDGNKGKPYVETDKPNPINVYGRTKLDAEKIVSKSMEKYYIVRTSALYGQHASRSKGNFVLKFVEKALSEGKVYVVSDVSTSPSYVRDVASTIWNIVLEGFPFGTYHVANDGYCSWYKFALEIAKKLSLKVRVEPTSIDELKLNAERPKFSALSSAKDIKLRTWKDALESFLTGEFSI